MIRQQAPNFTLAHANGQQVSLSDYRGRPVIITFSGRASQEQVREIRRTVRKCYTAEEVPVVQVAHLQGVPKLFQGLAKSDLRRGFEKEAQEEADSLRAHGRAVPDDLSEIIVILLDWKGEVSESFGLEDIDNLAAAVLVDANGLMQGLARGSEAGEQMLKLLGTSRV
jgi:hypothetical protein